MVGIAVTVANTGVNDGAGVAVSGTAVSVGAVVSVGMAAAVEVRSAAMVEATSVRRASAVAARSTTGWVGAAVGWGTAVVVVHPAVSKATAIRTNMVTLNVFENIFPLFRIRQLFG